MTEAHDARDVLVGPARDALTVSARGLTRLLGGAGTSAVSAAPAPMRSAIARALASLDHLPSATEEVEVLLASLHAQRLSLHAMQAELDALDGQLAMLEKSLAPVAALNHQLGRLRTSLDDLLAQSPHESGKTRADTPSTPDATAHRADDRPADTHHH